MYASLKIDNVKSLATSEPPVSRGLSSVLVLMLSTAIVIASLNASYAQSAATGAFEEGFSGDSTVPGVATGGSAVFDSSATFVAPDNLPIVDTYVESLMTLSDTEIANDLATVSVTPEGKIETVEATEEDIKIFRSAINELLLIIEADGEANVPVDDAGIQEGELGDATGAESVIPPDERVRIRGTTRYPFRTVGRIDNGCTGTLIGPRHLLTAGHCVYNIRNDRWYSALGFSPGQNGRARPYGTIGWKRAISVRGWTNSHKRNYDYAMIVLHKDIGRRVGWMGYGWKNPMPKYNVNINGYPGDKPSGTMWHSFCKMRIISSHRLYYPCDTAGGMSGSGVYVYFANSRKRVIYGIHAYAVDGTGFNGATRIRKGVFENLKRWKATY